VLEALNLVRCLDPASLRFTAFLSVEREHPHPHASITATDGALDTLAQWLDAHWPGRVLSMRSDPAVPVRLGDELEWGRKGEARVIIAESADVAAAATER
jgi:hypothetical protein